MASQTVESFMTLRQLAVALGQPVHVLRYAIALHGPKPTKSIGSAKVWRESDIEAVLLATNKTFLNSSKRRSRMRSR